VATNTEPQSLATTTTTTTEMPSIPPSPSLSKAAHLAAIAQIEREEQQLHEEIQKKLSERQVLQTILDRDSLPKKENGAPRR